MITKLPIQNAAVAYLPPPPIVGTDGDDDLWGTSNADEMWGGNGNDHLWGGAGNDRLFSGDGNDILGGGPGADYLDGGAGVDTAQYVYSSGSGVHVDLAAHLATSGDAEGDTLVSIENLVGSWSADTLQGDDGVNTLWGGGGDDHLEGRGGNDILYGESGNDVIDGGAGRESIQGGAGNDTLYGGNDDDWISGDNGNDFIDGGHGADHLDGGTGIDTLSYATSIAGVNVNLDTGAVSGGYAFLDTISGFENLQGSQFDDVLTGTDGITSNIYGEIANNVIQGFGGNDRIDGSAGYDRLEGGAGNDILTGGADGDTFVFQAVDQLPTQTTAAPPGDDVITDFQVDADHLEFSGIDTLYDLNFQEVNGNAVITYAHATGSITIEGVSLAQLLQHASQDMYLA